MDARGSAHVAAAPTVVRMSAPSPVPAPLGRARVRRVSVALVGLAAAATTAAPPVAIAASEPSASSASPSGSRLALDLGPAGLPETRSTTTVQPGVTLTRINRGGADPSLFWTHESPIPAIATSPDPDAPPRAISDQDSAQARPPAAGQGLHRPRRGGPPARDGGRRRPACWATGSGSARFPDQAAADAEKARLAAAGETASSVYTGWDGDASDRGPWHVNVLRIDPRTFPGGSAAPSGPTSTTGRRPPSSPRPPAPRPASTAGTSCWTPRPAPPATRPAPASTTAGSSRSPPTAGPRWCCTTTPGAAPYAG